MEVAYLRIAESKLILNVDGQVGIVDQSGHGAQHLPDGKSQQPAVALGVGEDMENGCYL
jgi:hypothetical protein